jgi:hypothetical protein
MLGSGDEVAHGKTNGIDEKAPGRRSMSVESNIKRLLEAEAAGISPEPISRPG